MQTVMILFPNYSAPGLQSRPIPVQSDVIVSAVWSVRHASWSGEETPTCHEDIARLWYASSFPQQFQQVPELSVDIAANGHRTRDGLNVGFFDEDGADFVAEGAHVRLGEVFTSHQLFYPLVRAGHHHGRTGDQSGVRARESLQTLVIVRVRCSESF